jgi:hypothetical protein
MIFLFTARLNISMLYVNPSYIVRVETVAMTSLPCIGTPKTTVTPLKNEAPS